MAMRAKANVISLANSRDPRGTPAYTIPEAAHYLRLPVATLRSWVVGRPYPVKAGRHYFQPVILLPEPKLRLLSFVNLVEAHVLSAIRREHRVALKKVRSAATYFRREMRSEQVSPLVPTKAQAFGGWKRAVVIATSRSHRCRSISLPCFAMTCFAASRAA